MGKCTMASCGIQPGRRVMLPRPAACGAAGSTIGMLFDAVRLERL
jgi:hypothetical protein